MRILITSFFMNLLIQPASLLKKVFYLLCSYDNDRGVLFDRPFVLQLIRQP